MSELTKGQKIAAAIAAIVSAAALGILPIGAAADLKTPADKFVRTADYYLRAGTDITPDLYPQLAKYDLLILPAEAQVYNAGMFPALRKLNPTILILAYVPSKSYNFAWSDALHQKLAAGIQNDWWLVDPSGSRVSVWQNTAVLNGATPWNAYLPKFVHDEIWSTGLWDGVLYDEFSANISWVNGGNLDLHHVGTRTDPALADAAWKQGMIDILKNTRDQLGADAVIVTNGDSTDELQPYVNGRMFESFPTPWEAGGTWSGVMGNYVRLTAKVGYPPVLIINANTGNTGQNADFRRVRYALGSTLLSDGFFSYDFGEADHGQLWRYDEEDAHLGRPLGRAVNILAPSKTNLAPGVWRRDFQNGAVLVNSTKQSQTVKFDGELEKLQGAQAPDVNDGSLVSSVTLPAEDGLLLLKPINKIVGSAFPNGAYARIFDARGARTRNGFFSYVAPFDGNATVELKDINGDGALEKIVADKKRVTIYGADGSVLASWLPYGDAYAAGLSLAVGDVNGDGHDEIVTGPGAGFQPLVKVFRTDGTAVNNGFLAYAASFKGGVQVAVGDLYNDGTAEIITGAGPGGGPQVRTFNHFRPALSFFAYDSRFRGGVQVAAGDVNGDGRVEIVTGPGPGGGPQVRIFNRNGRPLGPGFFAGDPAGRGGAKVAVTDVDGDNIDEIATLTTDIFQFSLAQ